MMEFLKKSKNVLLLLILLDLLVVALHLLFQGKALFNLDMESNVPTIYQGSKLILVGVLSFSILIFGYLKKIEIKREIFWIFWGLMFFLLGLDEIGQIHENISMFMKELIGETATSYEGALVEAGYSSTTWLPYYIALILIASFVVGISVKFFYAKSPKRAWYLISGWMILIGVIMMEYVNTMEGIMFQAGYWELAFVEELLEMVGISVLFVFTYDFFAERLESVRKSIK